MTDVSAELRSNPINEDVFGNFDCSVNHGRLQFTDASQDVVPGIPQLLVGFALRHVDGTDSLLA